MDFGAPMMALSPCPQTADLSSCPVRLQFRTKSKQKCSYLLDFGLHPLQSKSSLPTATQPKWMGVPTGVSTLLAFQFIYRWGMSSPTAS